MDDSSDFADLVEEQGEVQESDEGKSDEEESEQDEAESEDHRSVTSSETVQSSSPVATLKEMKGK
jgi:hypothetical protein